MGIDKKIKFDDVKIMTKEEAINEIKKHFKGNKKFIEQAIILIYSTHDFIKLDSMDFSTDNWNWEKFLLISVDTKNGFKHFIYRKGNKKYAPTLEREGNKTHDIDEYLITIYYNQTRETEEYRFS